MEWNYMTHNSTVPHTPHFWLLTTPFYKAVCFICKKKNSKMASSHEHSHGQIRLISFLININKTFVILYSVCKSS